MGLKSAGKTKQRCATRLRPVFSAQAPRSRRVDLSPLRATVATRRSPIVATATPVQRCDETRRQRRNKILKDIHKRQFGDYVAPICGKDRIEQTMNPLLFQTLATQQVLF